jgi:hypothetical protein
MIVIARHTRPLATRSINGRIERQFREPSV